MLTKILIQACLIVLFLDACKNIPCSNQSITPVFVGFSTSEIDTFIVRKYQKADNFRRLLDTALITNNSRIGWYISSHDTTIVLMDFIGGERKKQLIPDYDWQIYIPSLQRTDSIQDIVSPQEDIDCFKCSCWNPINSFSQNGTQVVPVQVKNHEVFGYSYPAYIHK